MRRHIESDGFLGEFWQFVLQRLGLHHNAATVACFDGTFVTDEAYWASPEMLHPAGSLAKGRFQELDDRRPVLGVLFGVAEAQDALVFRRCMIGAHELS